MSRFLPVAHTVACTVIAAGAVFAGAAAPDNAGASGAKLSDFGPSSERWSALRRAGAMIAQRHEDGVVSQIRFPGGFAVNVGPGAPVTPERIARRFLGDQGVAMGLLGGTDDLQTVRSRTLDAGSPAERSYVRFQQTHHDIPIFGAEAIVQTGATGKSVVGSVTANFLPGPAVSTTPVVATATAKELAAARMAKSHGVSMDDVRVSEPALWIYNPMLLGQRIDHSSLVWRVNAQIAGRLEINQLMLIDAQRGWISLSFNQVADARQRVIFDNLNQRSNNLALFAAARTEGQGPTGIADVDRAYDFGGDTYSFFFNRFGRDSIDGKGMQMIQTVRYCPGNPLASCPYENAFWNGEQMVYGNGFTAADDVVAHELTHGVTQYESNLFYYMQSGAINEALSDIFGELVDLTNGKGTDTPAVRWQMGEDITGGAIRNMMNPGLFGDPDGMTSSNYKCGPDDNGGVHSNSGVANKAAALLVDGGTHNGVTVAGIGITKTAQIWYEVASNMLFSAGDYKDLAGALNQACAVLQSTGGFGPADCSAVANAVLATRMAEQPTLCAAPEALVCPPTLTMLPAFYDNLENTSSGNWTRSTEVGVNQWYYPQTTYPVFGDQLLYATSGKTLIFGDDPDDVDGAGPLGGRTDSAIAMTRDMAVPTGTPFYFRFNHAYGFEYDSGAAYDGGVVEYSANGGTWTDMSTLPVINSYTGPIAVLSVPADRNPLAGRTAFVRESNGYISTRVDLSSLAGQNVRFRFRSGSDSSVGYWGWFIDDVAGYTCIDTSGFSRQTFLPLARR
jgi:bacillolysin